MLFSRGRAGLGAVVLAAAVAAGLSAAAGTPLAPPDRLTGVLVFPGDHPWGVYFEPGFSWEWARAEQQQRYRLLADGRTYVPSFQAAGDDDETVAARSFGVTSPAHLVEVEAERGRGPHFAVRSVRLLDGTPEIAWTLADKLREVRERFDGARRARRGALDAEFRRAREALRAHPGGRILRALEPFETVVYHPWWLPRSRRLVVYFAYKRQAGFWIKSRRPSQELNVKYAPPPEERGVSYAAALGARYVVDAAGRVVAEEVFPPEGFNRVPWAQRVLEGGDEGEVEAPAPADVEVVVRADQRELRAGAGVALTILLSNRGADPIWTNPSIVCTGSWDMTVRNASGQRLRVDDRDAMGCPGGGILKTMVAAGGTTKLDAGWDGRVRPRLGTSDPAPPGRYEIEATVRWADREGTPNARGPHAFVRSAKTSVVILP